MPAQVALTHYSTLHTWERYENPEIPKLVDDEEIRARRLTLKILVVSLG